jgi:LuxR family transcriptional regulator, maltose regulon positive regulatory protein
MSATAGMRMERQPGGLTGQGRAPGPADVLQVPRPRFRVLHRRRLIELVDRATRRRVTLVCAPGGSGKTVACAVWAAAKAGTCRIVWLTLRPDDDQGWFWARICSGIKQASVATTELVHALEDGSASAFPLRLVQTARLFAEPVVIVLDNVDNVTSDETLKGLDLLVRHAPPSLRLVLCGRRPPDLPLARLRGSGDLAEIGAADLLATTFAAVAGRQRQTASA